MDVGSGTVQLNVRMSRTLKSSGDAVLEEHGVSPSQVVRALWERLSQRGEAAQEVLDSLLGQEDSRKGERAFERVAVADEGTRIYAEACDRLGIGVPQDISPAWKEMREDSIAARLGERGVA